jgi:hypothetical protein
LVIAAMPAGGKPFGDGAGRLGFAVVLGGLVARLGLAPLGLRLVLPPGKVA